MAGRVASELTRPASDMKTATATPIREALVGRLVRLVVNQAADAGSSVGVSVATSADHDTILRLCLGAALGHDLTAAEERWLVRGVESALDLVLEPAAWVA